MDLMVGEIDYNTRIYRIVLSEDNRRVTKIAATGASFPLNVPSGNAFDLNSDEVYSDDKEMTIRFRCLGAMYNDDILVMEFNEHASMFNPNMKLLNEGKLNHGLLKLDSTNKMVNKHRGYPRIDPNTMELEWWVTKDELENSKGI